MLEFLFSQYKDTPIQNIILEFLAFVFGLISVCFAKKRNVLVYPTGLVATIISVYLLYKAEYFGDMTMNFYYSIYKQMPNHTCYFSCLIAPPR